MAFQVQMGFDILGVNKSGLFSCGISHWLPVVKVKWKPQEWESLYPHTHNKELHM